METEQTQTETAVTTALLTLLVLRTYPTVRALAPWAIETLRKHDYSVRGIARETRVPRTTLHRWHQEVPK